MKELLDALVHLRIKRLLFEPTANELIKMFRYLIVGGLAFLVDYLFFYVSGLFLGDTRWGIAASTVIGFMMGLVVNFFLSKKVVFTEQSRLKQPGAEFLIYGFIGVLGALLSVGLMWLFILAIDKYIAKIFVSMIVLFYNYFARKIVLYSKKRTRKEK